MYGHHSNYAPSNRQLAEATLSRCVPGADTTGFSMDLMTLEDGRLGVTAEGQARVQRISYYAAKDGLLDAVRAGTAVMVEQARREVYVPSDEFSQDIQKRLERREREFQQFLKWERGEVDSPYLPEVDSLLDDAMANAEFDDCI